jgi:HipA-like protein
MFEVRLHNFVIGRLAFQDEEWTFAYSEEFQENAICEPLICFPILNKVYKSKSLWPFFLARIPGLKQPAIQKVIQQEKIDPNDLPSLLQRFGKKAIQNPFELNVIS